MSETTLTSPSTISPLQSMLHENYSLRELWTTPAYGAFAGYTGSNAKFVIDSSWNLTLSTDSTSIKWGAGTAFITGSSAGGIVTVSIASAELARFNATGLGIGVTPAVMMHIKGAAATPRFRAESTGGAIVETAADSGTSGYTGTISNHPFTVITNSATRISVGTTGHIETGTDNTQTLGTASKRWSTVYAGTGSINTSDAREKTAVAPMTANEIAASRQIAGELGTFRFLDAIAKKGGGARLHIGMTVQRAMDIMTANGLDPFAYGFICHDAWTERVIEHQEETKPHDALVDARGVPVRVHVKDAWTERVPGGDRYAFRTDELLLFIARGFDARLAALEASA
jgi:hypothetical protein